MSGMTMDDREWRILNADLRGAPGRAQRGVTKVISRGAELIDEQMTVDATGHEGNWFGEPGTQYATHLEDHVSHEMLSPEEAEIGIEYEGAGKLAHIIAYGSVNNPGGQYDPALNPTIKTVPRIERLVADMGEGAVLGTSIGSYR